MFQGKCGFLNQKLFAAIKVIIGMLPIEIYMQEAIHRRPLQSLSSRGGTGVGGGYSSNMRVG